MDSQRAKPRIMNQSFWLLGGWPKRADGDMVLCGEEVLGVQKGGGSLRMRVVHGFEGYMVSYG